MRQSDNSEAVVTLLPMRTDDVTFLADLWVASWQETLPAIDFAARRAWIAAFLQESACVSLVAQAAGRLRGFVSLDGGHLYQLVVASDAKGDGTAVRLLDAAKARAAGGLTLDVNQANARALRFYAREGFAIVAAGVNATSGLATWRLRWRAAPDGIRA